MELHEARNAIRPVQEKEVEQQLEGTMHEKPSLIMLLSAKQEASRLLGEDAENRQARQMLHKACDTGMQKTGRLDQKLDPGWARNAISASVELRPRIAFR